MEQDLSVVIRCEVLQGCARDVNKIVVTRFSGRVPVAFKRFEPQGSFIGKSSEWLVGRNKQPVEQIRHDTDLVRLRIVGKKPARIASLQQQGANVRRVVQKLHSAIAAPMLEGIGFALAFPVLELKLQNDGFVISLRRHNIGNASTGIRVADRGQIERLAGGLKNIRKRIEP